MDSMFRRHLLLSALGACGTVLLTLATPRPSWWPQAASALRDRLKTILGMSPDAREIGAAYLAQHPGEADADRLVRLLTERPGISRITEPQELRRVFATQLRDDFAQGRTVAVRGWVLSRTEARLCALAALA